MGRPYSMPTPRGVENLPQYPEPPLPSVIWRGAVVIKSSSRPVAGSLCDQRKKHTQPHHAELIRDWPEALHLGQTPALVPLGTNGMAVAGSFL